jgi:hypothetical protein
MTIERVVPVRKSLNNTNGWDAGNLKMTSEGLVHHCYYRTGRGMVSDSMGIHEGCAVRSRTNMMRSA